LKYRSNKSKVYFINKYSWGVIYIEITMKTTIFISRLIPRAGIEILENAGFVVRSIRKTGFSPRKNCWPDVGGKTVCSVF